MSDPVKKIRVLVVDDSAYNRRALSSVLASSDRIEVIGTAFDGEDAIRKVLKLKPDAVTLDLEMPRMDGFALLRWLMVNHPVPVFVVSARESNRSVFKALDLGAADFIVKPQSVVPNMELIREEIVAKIAGVERMDVSKLAKRAFEAPRLAPTPAPKPVEDSVPGRVDGIIVVASSTGGPPAVQQLLTVLAPALTRTAIVIAQHMPPVFTALFAERLDKLLPLRVKEADPGEQLRPGHAYVLPGGRCARVIAAPGGAAFELREKLPQERYAPNADWLFISAAALYGQSALGVVLTGMGDDGAVGSAALRHAGAEVFAEGRETAVIFGMPQEALKVAGVQSWPLPELSAAASGWATRVSSRKSD